MHKSHAQLSEVIKYILAGFSFRVCASLGYVINVSTVPTMVLTYYLPSYALHASVGQTHNSACSLSTNNRLPALQMFLLC